MSEPTLQEILDTIRAAIEAVQEAVKRIKARQARQELASNSQTSGFTPAIWSPPQTNANTSDSDIDALSVTDLDTWLTQNETEVVRLMDENPM